MHHHRPELTDLPGHLPIRLGLPLALLIPTLVEVNPQEKDIIPVPEIHDLVEAETTALCPHGAGALHTVAHALGKVRLVCNF